MPRSREQKITITLSNEKPSISHEHLESCIDDLKNENETLKKKSNGLNKIVLKFTNGKRYWIACSIQKNVCLTRDVLIISQT